MYSQEQIRRAMALYAVTDGSWLEGTSLADCVQLALQGGATFVQLREKNMSEAAMILRARSVQSVCREAQVPFIINDFIEVARRVGADGVHVGQGDSSVLEARQALGDEAIVGASVQTVEQALEAQAQGADYLGVGAIFATDTKTDAEVVGIDGLRKICESVAIPVVAIGGIKVDNVNTMAETGVDGIAVVSALFAALDIEGAARQLRAEVSSALNR